MGTVLPGRTPGTQEPGSPPPRHTVPSPGQTAPTPKAHHLEAAGAAEAAAVGSGARGPAQPWRGGVRTEGQTDKKQEGLRCRGNLSDPNGHRFLAPPLAACSGNPARRRERRGGERGQGRGADAPPSLRARPTSRGHAETPAPSGGGGAWLPPTPPDAAFCARDTSSLPSSPAPQFPALGPEGVSWRRGNLHPNTWEAGHRRILIRDSPEAGDQVRW